MKLEELQVLISANADQFKSELISVKESLQKLTQIAQTAGEETKRSLFSPLFKANLATQVFMGAVSKVTGTLKAFSSQVIADGSALARLRIANSVLASNLGLTSQEIQKLRDDLAEANTYGVAAEQIISTLALSGLVQLAQNLEYVDARTGETATGVTALTLAIKDLAAARGVDSDFGIQQIAKFIQRGETSFADGLIEIGDITQKYKEYAKSIGKESGDALTEIERAQVRLNIVLQEGAKSFGAYAATYGSSGKIMSSIPGLIQAINQEIGVRLEPVLRVGSFAIWTFFKGIADAVRASGDAIQSFAIKVAGWMVALVRLVGRLLSSLPFIGGVFKGLAEFTLKPIKAQGELQQSLGTTGKAMDATGKKAGTLKKQLENLAGFDEMNILQQPEGAGGSGLASESVSSGLGVGALSSAIKSATGFADVTNDIMEVAGKAEQSINNLIKSFAEFWEKLKSIKVFGIPVVSVLSEIGKYAGIAFLGFNVLSPVLKLIIEGLGFLSPLLKTIVGGFGLLQSVLGFVAPLFGSLLTPLGLVVGGLTLLAAGFVAAWQNSEEFRNSVQAIIEKTKEVGQRLASVFAEKLPALLEALRPLEQFLRSALSAGFEFLGKAVEVAWKNALAPLANFLLDRAAPAFSAVLDIVIFLVNAIGQLAGGITKIAVPAFGFLSGVFVSTFATIQNILRGVWEAVIKPVFWGLFDLATKLVIPVIITLAKYFEITWNGARVVVESAWGGILQAMAPVVAWMSEKITPVLYFLKEQFAFVWGVVKMTADRAWENIRNGLRLAINRMIDLFNGFIDNINRMLTGLDGVSHAVGVRVEYRLGKIPKLATGGYIKSPVMAMMGEGNYGEVVLPLERNTEWAEKLAKLINSQNKGGNGAVVVVKLGESTIFEKFIEYINDRTLYSNKSLLNL